MELDLIALTSLLVSSILSIVALVISLYTFKVTSAMQEYSNLDTLYQTLLNTGIDHPEFRNQGMTLDYKNKFLEKSQDGIPTRLQYETYAFNVWNFCEAICDDFLNYKKLKDQMLVINDQKYYLDWISWKPALITETKLHWKWFNEEENQSKFKDQFKDAVKILMKENKINTLDIT